MSNLIKIAQSSNTKEVDKYRIMQGLGYNNQPITQEERVALSYTANEILNKLEMNHDLESYVWNTVNVTSSNTVVVVIECVGYYSLTFTTTVIRKPNQFSCKIEYIKVQTEAFGVPYEFSTMKEVNDYLYLDPQIKEVILSRANKPFFKNYAELKAYRKTQQTSPHIMKYKNKEYNSFYIDFVLNDVYPHIRRTGVSERYNLKKNSELLQSFVVTSLGARLPLLDEYVDALNSILR